MDDRTIFVLAGTNGSGKSSIGGTTYRAAGHDYVNPDEWAARLQRARQELTIGQAQAIVWHENVRHLRAAIAHGRSYAFETTLGGRTITAILRDAATRGIPVHVWYVGLDDPERNLARIASRVRAGGHDIPEEKVRARHLSSLRNLVTLVPFLARLEVFDNSVDADPKAGRHPQIRRVLLMDDGRIREPATHAALTATPEWARAVVMAALKHARRTKPA